MTDTTTSRANRAEAMGNGLRRFMGSPCKNGHDGLRYACGDCVECAAARVVKRRGKTPRTPPFSPERAGRLVQEFFALSLTMQLCDTDVARISGKNQRTLSGWRHGRTKPRLDTFEAALAGLGYEMVICKIDT
jgi:hypothetical protein